MEIKKFTRLSILLSLSVALNVIEASIPLLNGFIPGLKIGLANIVTLFVIYKFNFKDALYLGILRVLLVGMLRTGIFSTTFFFSLSGVVLSVIFMTLGKKYINLSIIGVSILGSIGHCIGQVITAIIILQNNAMFYYLPWLLIFSIPTGILVGLIGKQLITYYDDNFID